jgi:hypothetical protein
VHWNGIGSSTDGGRLVAAASEGMIYVSPDAGRTWSLADAPHAQWQVVACSADGTKLLAGIYNIWNSSPGGIYSADMPPLLNIKRNGDSTILSWPAWAQGFGLQETSDFASSNWTDVPNVQSSTNAQTQVTVASQSGAHFFRLIHR